jgi:hypothetical protein
MLARLIAAIFGILLTLCGAATAHCTFSSQTSRPRDRRRRSAAAPDRPHIAVVVSVVRVIIRRDHVVGDAVVEGIGGVAPMRAATAPPAFDYRTARDWYKKAAERALVRNGRKAIAGENSVGKPAKLDVLFCRDPIPRSGSPGEPPDGLPVSRPRTVDQVDDRVRIAGLERHRRRYRRAVCRTVQAQARRRAGDPTARRPHCRPGPLRRFIRNARRSVRRRVRALQGTAESA